MVHVIAITALVGCGSESVETYEVPKGIERIADESLPGHAHLAGHQHVHEAPASAAAPAMPWTMVPSTWSERPDPGEMRVATFLATDPDGNNAEVAVTRFPGDVGGVLANVNRWRGQVGLGPVGEEALEGLLQPFETPGFTGHIVRLEGPRVHMLAASIFEVAANETWFVRVVADAETVDHLADDVTTFSQSFQRAGGY